MSFKNILKKERGVFMAISEAERIRRAEELYYKRRYNQNYRGSIGKEKTKKRSFIKWFIGKIIYILLIIACVYGYNNKDYFLSEKFKDDFNEFIKSPVDINKLVNILYTNVKENVDNLDGNQENELINEQENNSENEDESKNRVNIINTNIINEELGNLSKKISNQAVLKTSNVKTSDLTLEEYILSKCEFVKPLTR